MTKYEIRDTSEEGKELTPAVRRWVGKLEGVKAGVPDVWLPVARQGFHGLVIELKADETKRPSKEQERWIRELTDQGYLAVVCHGCEAAKGVLMAYLDPPLTPPGGRGIS